ncbi:MAG: tape measure protein [Clostridiaceae bacterium]|nr:tape measure protein [Clostridiaceae bacterium]
MSREIDNRVVQMEFDNRKFESNAKESINTIDRLKQSLNFDESVNSLSKLENAGKKFSLDGIGASVDLISGRFSIMGIAGVTAIQNVVNSAINAGKNLVKSLTVDPVKTGLNEYETKMNAITTIMTNTASKGTTLSDVNATLDELNKYADLTIYNFAEMTRNIGTFTAAGIGLKDSAIAIKGIANLAAGSGSNSQQASTAMYQLSQALAAGSVKLMDWNSVVNAGMGGELFQNALKKTAKAMGIVVNESVPFRESLNSGWITSDVLIKTLQDFAEDKSLLKAATEVKTLTQLIDTMKESVQSGWATTWEKILGDKDQAAALFTALNDGFGEIVGASADARNEMLQFWNENRGREYIIKSIGNAFLFLGQILQPIQDAFSEIFPPMTGERLVELSKKLYEFTERLTISAETSENIKRTFRGLFAVLDIIGQALSASIKGLISFIKYLLPAGDGLLSFTGNIGDFLVALNYAIKSSDLFNLTIKKIGDVLKPIADGVKSSVKTIVNSFALFAQIDTSGMDSFAERVKIRFEPLTKTGEILGIVFTSLASILKKTAPIFFKTAEIISKALNQLADIIINALNTGDFQSIFDIINGTLFTGILLGIKKFISSLTGISDNVGGFLGSITNIFDSVRDSLKAYQDSLKAKTLMTISGAIATLTASLIILSLIDSEKLSSSLTAIGVMFTELFLSMSLFTKYIQGKGLAKIGISIITLSSAILVLSVAMKSMAKLSWNEVIKGLTSVTILIAVLSESSKLLSASSNRLMKGSLNLILFATAINILAVAVKKLSDLDVGDLSKGLIGVGVLATELALFMKATEINKMGTLKSVGLIALSGAILILANAVKTFSLMTPKELIKGLGAIAIILTELALFTNLTGNSKHITTTAVGLTILSASMLIISKAIGNMGSLSLKEIGKGLLAMAGSLTILAIAMSLMPKDLLLTGTGLVVVASSLLILANALNNFGDMSWGEIAKGLITLAASLTIIAVAMTFMSSALPGAAALLIIAGSLAILAPLLATLGSMSLSEIGKGLLAIAGTFTVLGLAGLILAPLTPIILALTASIALLGIGCVAVGAGVLLLASGLATLAISGAAGAVALVGVVATITGLIPVVLTSLANGLINFIVTLSTGLAKISSTLMRALEEILLSALNVIRDLAEPLTDTILYVVTVALKQLEKYVPTILQLLWNVIVVILTPIIDAISNFGYDAGFALGDALFYMWDSAKVAFDDLKERMTEFGQNLLKGLIKGINDVIQNNALLSAVTSVGVNVVDTLAKVFDINSPSREMWILGQYVVMGLGDGIKDNEQETCDQAESTGSNVVSSFINGLKSKSKELTDVKKSLFGVEDKSRASAGAYYYQKYTGQEAPDVYGKSNNLMSSVGKSIFGMDFSKKAEESGKSIDSLNSGLSGLDGNAKKTKTSLDAAFQKSSDWIEEEKYYNRLSLEDELVEWEKVQKSYLEGSEERKKADREIYRVKNEIEKKSFENSEKWIDERKYYNELSLEDELASWERVQNRYNEGTDERKKADREVYRLKKAITEKQKELDKEAFDNAINLIEEKKYYNKINLAEELVEWEKVQKSYLEGSEERKKADREVYRVKKELNEKQIEIDEEYYYKTQEINDRLMNNIRYVSDEYDNAFNSRKQSLYNSYGLFDEVTEKEAVDGKKLLLNLNDQVDEFEYWQELLQKLEKRKVNSDLLNELQDMGPSAIKQVQALTKLTDSELTTYVSLWKKKNKQAKAQATLELEDLRKETQNKIKELQNDADIELEKVKTIWEEKTNELKVQTTEQVETMNKGIVDLMKELRGKMEEELGTTVTNIYDNFVKKSLSVFPDALREKLSSSLGIINDIGDNPDNTLTIKPVLDSSQMKSDLDGMLGYIDRTISTSPAIGLGSMIASSIGEKSSSEIAKEVDNKITNINNNSITIQEMNVRKESDIREIARELDTLRQRSVK